MAALGDHLEVIRAMLGPGRATYEGRYAHVRGAINVPKGIQGHIPIIVGGNGERVTAGYAIRYADELNYVFLDAKEIQTRMASVRARCEQDGQTGRNPGEPVVVGQERVDANRQQEHLQREQHTDVHRQRDRDLTTRTRQARPRPCVARLFRHRGSPSPRASSAHTVPSRTSTSMRPSGRCGGPASTSPVSASK